MESQIKQLQVQVRDLCTAKGWRENLNKENARNNRQGYAFAAYIALAHSELSEALEAYRDKIWSHTVEDTPDVEDEYVGKPIGVGPELADVFIRILDMCDIWNIDLEYEVERVMAYGWTRSYRHGGKQL